MSKNSIYTFDYFQPKEYRFSLDSVFLAQKVAKIYENHINLENLHFLDLCAGCGVIGLELAIHLKKIKKFDFIEVQDVYIDYFTKNLNEIIKYPNNFQFILGNYENLKLDNFKNKYDVIVSNPPYFLKGEGLHSPSEFKNRCRFFMDSNLDELLNFIIFSLKPKAMAFVLVRPGNHHGRNTVQYITEYLNLHRVEIIDDVRGTHIVKITKKGIEI